MAISINVPAAGVVPLLGAVYAIGVSSDGSIGAQSISNITTATTTLVKTGTGQLNSITVNSLGTVASTAVIYDGIDADGTRLGTINTLALSGAFVYNLPFTVGLCIVTTGTIAPNLTVVYR